MPQHKSVPCPACYGRGNLGCWLCSGSGRHVTQADHKYVNGWAVIGYALALLIIVAAVVIYLPLMGDWLIQR
jgi:hypothetical protein